MSWSVNDMVQTACEDLVLTDDGVPVSGALAAQAENCLNRAITDLNSDGYMSLSAQTVDRMSAGAVYFRKLEAGETMESNTVDMEPPDTVTGVSRKLGIRWMPLRPTNKQAIDRQYTYSLPTSWSYGIETEATPGGTQRNVGVLRLNGTNPVELRIYIHSQLSHYRLGDTMYLPSLYYNLVLYALERRLVIKYKLKSYQEDVERDLLIAKKAINTNNANNRPLDSGLECGGTYLDCYEDLVAGVGL